MASSHRNALRHVIFVTVLLLAPAVWAAACGGSSGHVDLSKVPTATMPSKLPEPTIISGTPIPGGTSGRTYTVQAGDSPSSIAERFGITTEALMKANSITDPTRLGVGQTLTIPGSSSNGTNASPTPRATGTPQASATATPASSGTATPPAGGTTYVVQAGDFPANIAPKFGITPEELMKANGITDPSSLQIGQVLIIPTPSARP